MKTVFDKLIETAEHNGNLEAEILKTLEALPGIIESLNHDIIIDELTRLKNGAFVAGWNSIEEEINVR